MVDCYASGARRKHFMHFFLLPLRAGHILGKQNEGGGGNLSLPGPPLSTLLSSPPLP